MPQITFWSDGVAFKVAPPYASLVIPPVVRHSRVLHWLVKNSEVVRSRYTSYRALRSRPAMAATQYEESKLTGAQVKETELVEALVLRLATEVREAGASFAVMIASDSSALYERQKKQLSGDRIVFFDATTGRLAAAAGKGVPILYRYNRHWTPAAHAAAADLLAAGIRQHHL